MTIREPDRVPSGADAIVVGAGVIGAAVALELARADRRVVVVDKSGGAGHGSTSASSAIIRFNFSTWEGVAVAWEAHYCWARWADHLGTSRSAALAGFRRTGAILLDAPDSGTSEAVALFDRVGVPYERWDAATLRSRIPGIDTGRHWPPSPSTTTPSSPGPRESSARCSHPTRASSTIRGSRRRTSRTRRSAGERASSTAVRSPVSCAARTG